MMNETAIAAELLLSVESIRTAFDIAAALPALRQMLVEKFTQQVTLHNSDLQGNHYQEWQGFTKGEQRVPFLIRRVTPGLEGLAALPWKRYSIGLEFDRGRLLYGIRFDCHNWHPDDSTAALMPAEASKQLSQLLPTPNGQWEWWPWAGPENDRQLCIELANPDAAFLNMIREKITDLAAVLGSFHSSVQLPPSINE